MSDEAIGNIILEGLNGTLGGGQSVNEGAEGAGDSVINGASDISGNNISPNPSGESEAIPFVNLVPVQKEYSCCVCWGNLDMENSVSTLCNHFYCKKCFFRWIEVSATCALCRTPLDTKSHLTEEQFMRENSECYQRYKEILITNARLSSKNLKLIRIKIGYDKSTLRFVDYFHKEITNLFYTYKIKNGIKFLYNFD